MDLGIEVAGEPDETALAGLLRRLERLDRPSGSEDLLDVIQGLDGVGLPEVEIVGLQQAEGGLQLLLRLPFAVRLMVLEVRKTFFRTPCRPMP